MEVEDIEKSIRDNFLKDSIIIFLSKEKQWLEKDF